MNDACEHVCPMCHSTNIDRVPSGDVLERLVLRFRRKRSYRCRDCGHAFSDFPVSKQSSPARRSPMDESVAPARMESQKPLTKWVDEMRDVFKVITGEISEESARQRAATESAQREYTKGCEEVARLRTETERANGLAATAQQERDALREEVGRLRAENEQLQRERAEAGEAARKLLDEMNELVTEVVNKFHGPPRTSPFAREAKGITQTDQGAHDSGGELGRLRPSDESHGGTVRPVD